MKCTSYINKSNLITIITHLLKKGRESSFENARINELIYKLHHLLSDLQATNRGVYYSQWHDVSGGSNANFPDLQERYLHVDFHDPTIYKHEIKNMLLAGTNTAELDVSSTAVYIFSKYISKDDELLKVYTEKDFYSIIPTKSRDLQKNDVQVWLQGVYNPDNVYNKLFTKTANYLKSTAIRDNDAYKRNSGLIRDIEVNALNKILNNTPVLFHLHDGVYVNSRNVKKTQDAFKKAFGDDVKTKVTNFSKMQFSESDIIEILDSLSYDAGYYTPEMESLLPYKIIMTTDDYGTPIHAYQTNDGEKIPLPAYINQKLYCQILGAIQKPVNEIDSDIINTSIWLWN